MTDDQQRPPVKEKDRIPPEEGIVVPAEERDRVNDRGPTDEVDPARREGDLPPRRPTDGPL